MVLDAPKGGVRFTFLVRLVPVNQALLSYALGAAGVPLRVAVAGNLGMFTHMLPTVYFGAAAVHMTRMAGKGHREWEIDGVLLMLGLGVCVAVAAADHAARVGRDRRWSGRRAGRRAFARFLSVDPSLDRSIAVLQPGSSRWSSSSSAGCQSFRTVRRAILAMRGRRSELATAPAGIDWRSGLPEDEPTENVHDEEIRMLRIATWTLALWVLALATPSSAVDLCAKLDGKTGEVKDGTSVKLRTLCKTKNGTPVEASVGTAVSFAETPGSIGVLDTDTEIAKLSDPSAGGVLVVATPVRIVLTGSVTIGNSANNGEFSIIDCQFQVSGDGGPFEFVGVASSTESIGNTNHDEQFNVSLVTVIDRAAGSYDARIVCRDTFSSASSGPAVRGASFSAVSTPH